MNRIREILHNYLFYISTRIKLPWGGGGGGGRAEKYRVEVSDGVRSAAELAPAG